MRGGQNTTETLVEVQTVYWRQVEVVSQAFFDYLPSRSLTRTKAATDKSEESQSRDRKFNLKLRLSLTNFAEVDACHGVQGNDSRLVVDMDVQVAEAFFVSHEANIPLRTGAPHPGDERLCISHLRRQRKRKTQRQTALKRELALKAPS